MLNLLELIGSLSHKIGEREWTIFLAGHSESVRGIGSGGGGGGWGLCVSSKGCSFATSHDGKEIPILMSHLWEKNWFVGVPRNSQRQNLSYVLTNGGKFERAKTLIEGKIRGIKEGADFFEWQKQLAQREMRERKQWCGKTLTFKNS